MEQYYVGHDLWGQLQDEIRHLQAAQYEHDSRLIQHQERLDRLEKSHDNGTRISSIWSTPSPFPAPLSTYAQQPNSTTDAHANYGAFDGQHIGLPGPQFDEVDIPRRGASRANSVRFDDSAMTNHWRNDSPTHSDYFGSGHRTTNSLGGYVMTERSSSHKSDQRSDGRQSSLRSFGPEIGSGFDGENATFRPPTQGTDILDSCLHRTTAPTAGPAPAIIRCWLNSTSGGLGPWFYAVVCTGSTRSSIESSLVSRLGLQDHVEHHSDRGSSLQVTMHFPDAQVLQQTRASTHPRLARLTVEFKVVSQSAKKTHEDGVGAFIGSDIMAAHMGDVLFSQNRVVLNVDDGRKVFIPFSRPETEDAFSDILTIHADPDTNDDSKSVKGLWSPPQAALDALAITLDNQPQVSSPRPVRGGQASVIQNVTTSLASPDFSPKDDSDTNSNGTESKPPTRTPSAARTEPTRSSPWTRPSTRTESFESNDSSRRPSTPHAGEASTHEASTTSTIAPSSTNGSTATGSSSNDTVTRGRSLTNPFQQPPASSPSTPSSSTIRPIGSSVWDGARKSSLTNPSSTSSSTRGSQVRQPSRGMKVLRPSKSFSASEKAAVQRGQGANGDASATPGSNGTTSAGFGGIGNGNTSNKIGMGNAVKSFGKSSGNGIGMGSTGAPSGGHSRAVSSDLGAGTGGQQKGMARAKSSNVVGPASAFSWMMQNGGIAGGIGGGGSGTGKASAVEER